jgi:hypothetical protein
MIPTLPARDDQQRLVDNLPESGALIACSRQDVSRRLHWLIHERRGPELLRRCRITVIREPMDLHRLRGLKGPLIVDPQLWRHHNAELRHQLAVMESHINKRPVPVRSA